MAEAQAYQIPDPDIRCEEPGCEHPKYLLISPQAVRVEHSQRGLMQEIFCPEGIELNLRQYTCPNPECDCPDDYYMEVAIKIPKAEYDRIRSQPGWTQDEGDDDDA